MRILEGFVLCSCRLEIMGRLRELGHNLLSPTTRALNEGYAKGREDFTITEKAPTRALSWLKRPLALSHLRHY